MGEVVSEPAIPAAEPRKRRLLGLPRVLVVMVVVPVGAIGLTFLMPYVGTAPRVLLWALFAALVFLLQRDGLTHNRIGGTVLALAMALIGCATAGQAADLALLSLNGRQVEAVQVGETVGHKNYRTGEVSHTCDVTHLDGSKVPGGRAWTARPSVPAGSPRSSRTPRAVWHRWASMRWRTSLPIASCWVPSL